MGQVRWPGGPVFCIAAALLAGCAGASAGGGQHKPGANACLVSDGAGGARVADPCPSEARFTVGGTVTGLEGTLVLENAGLDTLPVTADGAFTFDVAVADGAPYRVTITNQPSAHGRTCAVADGEGLVDGADVTGVTVTCVITDASIARAYAAGTVDTASFDPAQGAVYDQASHWNQWVRGDGAGALDASGTPCDGTEIGPWGVCVHGGEARAFEVPGAAACDGLTAADALGAFDWTCDDTGGTVRMVTSSLRPGVGLSALLDFDAVAWKDEVLRVSDAAGEVFATEPAPWWGNPVYAVNGGGELDLPGAIFLVTRDTDARFLIRSDHVALVVAPGATLHGPGTGGTVVAVRDAAFLWLEGRIDARGDADAVRADRVRLSVLDGVSAQRAGHAGVFLNDARTLRVSRVRAVQNDAYGVRADAATGSLFTDLLVAGNALSGLHLNGGADNRMAGVTASGNGNWGVALRSTWTNVLVDVTAANQQAYGVWLDRSPGNTLMNIAAVNNGGDGLYAFDSPGMVLANFAGTDNGSAGLALRDSSGNHLTGLLLLGHNAWDCTEEGGTHPGLENLTCAGADGSDPVVTNGVTLGDAFLGPVFTDDAAQGGDTFGAAAESGITDWLSFDGPFRHFGRNAVVFPDPDNRGRCASGVCRVWDWTLAPDDRLVHWALEPPTGERALTHFWADAGVSVFLPDAVERMGDGVGNENLLCESGETCVVTFNVAADQGSDALVDAGFVGTGGAVENVTLLSRGVVPPDPEPLPEDAPADTTGDTAGDTTGGTTGDTSGGTAGNSTGDTTGA